MNNRNDLWNLPADALRHPDGSINLPAYAMRAQLLRRQAIGAAFLSLRRSFAEGLHALARWIAPAPEALCCAERVAPQFVAKQ